MQTQQQSQHNDHSQEKREKRKKFSRNLLLVLTILIAAFAISVVLVLNGLSVLTGPWTPILLALFAVLGVVLGTFQAFPSLLRITKQEPQGSPTQPPPLKLFPNTMSQETSAAQPGTYLPFRRNPLFQPRPGEFDHLETLLLRPDAPQQPVRVGVTGMGGIGKTQLAVEFAYRYQDRFPGGIFWMSAIGRTLFDWQRQLAELASNADYLPADDLLSNPENERKRARHLCRYLGQHADALLILDNVEAPELVTAALPILAGGDLLCAILYTSRVPSAPPEVKVHSVERLPEHPALRLLLETTRPQLWDEVASGRESAETRAAHQVCERVGYLPLALVHLRGRLAQDPYVTLSRLAEVLQQDRLTSLKQILFETFRWSWEQVSDEAMQRLFLLACSFPEATSIPLWLLGLAAGLGERAESFELLGEACLGLQAVNLFERLSGDLVRLHPLVRDFGHQLLIQAGEQGDNMRQEAGQRLVTTFSDLVWLEKRARGVGYWACLEQVRATRDYALLLHTHHAAQLSRLERWLDRESYLLADERWWPETLPGLFYQQLFNRAVDAGEPLAGREPPVRWIKGAAPVGADDQALLRVFAGHTGVVYSVAFSPDGRLLLTGSADRTARLWEAASGKELATLQGHTGAIGSVAFSPDGTKVLTGSEDRTARLWEIASGKELATLAGHRSWVQSVAFSPDGIKVLTGSYDTTVRVWEAASGKKLATLAGHHSWVQSVAFSPDGTKVLTGSRDGTAQLWEIASGKKLATLAGHRSWVQSIAFSPDGTKVLTGSRDGTARLWEIASGKELATLGGHFGTVDGVMFSPDGNLVLTSFGDEVRLWETVSGKLLAHLAGHSYVLFRNKMAFSPDGHLIMTYDQDGYVFFWQESPPEIGRLLGVYVAVYQVRAVYWQDATHLLLADTSGARGHPSVYRLSLEGPGWKSVEQAG